MRLFDRIPAVKRIFGKNESGTKATIIATTHWVDVDCSMAKIKHYCEEIEFMSNIVKMIELLRSKDSKLVPEDWEIEEVRPGTKYLYCGGIRIVSSCPRPYQSSLIIVVDKYKNRETFIFPLYVMEEIKVAVGNELEMLYFKFKEIMKEANRLKKVEEEEKKKKCIDAWVKQ